MGSMLGCGYFGREWGCGVWGVLGEGVWGKAVWQDVLQSCDRDRDQKSFYRVSAFATWGVGLRGMQRTMLRVQSGKAGKCCIVQSGEISVTLFIR